MRKLYLCRSIVCLTAALPMHAVLVPPSMVLAGAGRLDGGERDPPEDAMRDEKGGRFAGAGYRLSSDERRFRYG